jgi:hypothetical protein
MHKKFPPTKYKKQQSGAGIGNQSPQTKGKGNRARCDGVRKLPLAPWGRM